MDYENAELPPQGLQNRLGLTLRVLGLSTILSVGVTFIAAGADILASTEFIYMLILALHSGFYLTVLFEFFLSLFYYSSAKNVSYPTILMSILFTELYRVNVDTPFTYLNPYIFENHHINLLQRHFLAKKLVRHLVQISSKRTLQ